MSLKIKENKSKILIKLLRDLNSQNENEQNMWRGHSLHAKGECK